MNDLVKNKKTSNPHSKQQQTFQQQKNASSSAKHLPSHCLPKNPPNIAQYQHYAHPRKQEELKENQRSK